VKESGEVPTNSDVGCLEVDGEGRLVVPPDLARRFGLTPGARVPVERFEDQLVLSLPTTHLARLYLEPTTSCPLSCPMCVRHAWSGPVGTMSDETFALILSGLRDLPSLPSVFLGGYGEPLSHPGIVDMVARLKQLGAEVELITGGTLLDAAMVDRLVQTGLDVLWVSLDGATPECYGEVRDAAQFERVIDGLRHLETLTWGRRISHPQLGIAFTVMRRNREELSKVIELGERFGATRFSVTNVHPHVAALEPEMLCGKIIGQDAGTSPSIDLARMDDGSPIAGRLANLVAAHGLRLHGQGVSAVPGDCCPFVRKSSMTIRWDGACSPCLPLLHGHTAYLQGRRRHVQEHLLGRLGDRSIRETWEDHGYRALRDRLQRFGYPPCHRCNSCDAVDGNREPCAGLRGMPVGTGAHPLPLRRSPR
jgi:molybdenum cofactor biosynthesis enzyme MoaA